MLAAELGAAELATLVLTFLAALEAGAALTALAEAASLAGFTAEEVVALVSTFAAAECWSAFAVLSALTLAADWAALEAGAADCAVTAAELALTVAGLANVTCFSLTGAVLVCWSSWLAELVLACASLSACAFSALVLSATKPKLAVAILANAHFFPDLNIL